jgi:transcription antitermination protein NusB
MPARHRSRQRALQVLFQWDVRAIPIDEAIAAFNDTLHSEEEAPPRAEADPFMEDLVHGTTEAREELDRLIASKASNWRLDRMAAVDRNLLRLAVHEMLHTDTPPAVVIDEALELAHQFSGDDSVSFVNGVLDAVRKDLPPRSGSALSSSE